MDVKISSDCVNSVPINVGKASVNDIQFDFFGNRVATCFTDHHIRIYERTVNDDIDTEYTETCSWKAHNASVWRVSWAHPEFGQILASCSLDRQVIIWEEIIYQEMNDTKATRATSPLPGAQSNWIKRVTFVDSRANVSDVRFAPKYFGLLVAFTSFDGSFRVYEVGSTRNLSVWSLQAEVPIESDKPQEPQGSSFVWLPALSSLAWSNAHHGLPIIAIGVDRSVQYGQSTQRRITKSNQNPSHLQCWQSTIESIGNGVKKWKRIDNLNLLSRVRDVLFAPCNGCAFHLLAAALEHEVELYTISFSSISRHQEPSIRKVTSIHRDYHTATVERIRWNVTGSVILSTDAHGVVVASRAASLDRWERLDNLLDANKN
ncbi:hypothetical protein GJ496_007463 [Pomphorhynchus laevis]|nr:hypothetical protein GJ496_007463 [Pomphorhynchus laevis]